MRLPEADKERLVSFYARDFYAHTENARRVHWSEEDGQLIRFGILELVGDLSGQTVLDVGCGLGDFYKYLTEQYPGLTYIGLDIVPEFIAYAREAYPETPFLWGDFMDLPEDIKFDYVLSSGALSFKVQNSWRFYTDFIRKMYRLARVGAGFNMLRGGRHPDDDIYATYDPELIVRFGRTFAPEVNLIADYLPDDFTVFLRK